MSSEGTHRQGMSKHRLEALTDGIYAIALTLLVLELKLPELPHETTDGELLARLVALWPKLGSWLVSFLFLSLLWTSNQRGFHYVKKVDQKLTTLNLWLLLFVSVMPFTASVLGEHGNLFVGAAIYSLNLLMLGVLGYLHVNYLVGHPELQEPLIAPATGLAMKVRVLGTIVCAALAMLAAIWSPRGSALVYLLMIPVFLWSRTIQLRN
jgi:uncharacterized membrane protein